jgi:hypothetical protein
MSGGSLDISEYSLIYKRMSLDDTGDARSGVAKAILRLVIATSAEAAIVVGHFLYAARLYDDPYRAHPVEPVAIAVVVVILLAVVFWRTGSAAALWLLSAAVAIPFVGMFGGYHGGFLHVAKLVMFAAGTSPESLEAIIDSPDFAVPDDLVFETSGVLCLVTAVVVAWTLVQLLRAARHGRKRVQTAATQNA